MCDTVLKDTVEFVCLYILCEAGFSFKNFDCVCSTRCTYVNTFGN